MISCKDTFSHVRPNYNDTGERIFFEGNCWTFWKSGYFLRAVKMKRMSCLCFVFDSVLYCSPKPDRIHFFFYPDAPGNPVDLLSHPWRATWLLVSEAEPPFGILDRLWRSTQPHPSLYSALCGWNLRHTAWNWCARFYVTPTSSAPVSAWHWNTPSAYGCATGAKLLYLLSWGSEYAGFPFRHKH